MLSRDGGKANYGLQLPHRLVKQVRTEMNNGESNGMKNTTHARNPYEKKMKLIIRKDKDIRFHLLQICYVPCTVEGM